MSNLHIKHGGKYHQSRYNHFPWEGVKITCFKCPFNLIATLDHWNLKHLQWPHIHLKMGSVISSLVEDYNTIFSYRLPSQNTMEDSSDEEEPFMVYVNASTRIVNIDTSDSDWTWPTGPPPPQTRWPPSPPQPPTSWSPGTPPRIMSGQNINYQQVVGHDMPGLAAQNVPAGLAVPQVRQLPDPEH